MTPPLIWLALVAYIFTVWVCVYFDRSESHDQRLSHRENCATPAGRGEKAGHLSSDAELRIWRIVRRIH